MDRDNRLIVITSSPLEKTDQKMYLNNNHLLSVIKIPDASPFYSFIPTTLVGQLLSYYTAVELDGRKIYFQNLIDLIFII